MMGSGVPAGANHAVQLGASSCGYPASRIVGTSENCTARVGPVVTIGMTLPAFTRPTYSGMPSTVPSSSPDSRAWIMGGPPL